MGTIIQERLLEQMRENVDRLIKNELYASAIFFADKLASMTANVYYLNSNYKRALLLLTKDDMFKKSLSALYLAARCAVKIQDWNLCLEYLGEDESNMLTTFRGSINDNSGNLLSAICLLRGKAFASLDKLQKAATWFQEAIRRDIYCFEAFEELQGYTYTANEIQSVIEGVTFPEEALWLKQYYLCRLMKHNSAESQTALNKMSEIETKLHLGNNPDLAIVHAEIHFYNNNFQQSYDITRKVLKEDPHNLGTVVTIHLSTMVELRLKNELFYYAHKLVEEDPESCVSWYGVGCYYYLIGNYELARRHFNKCTSLDGKFGAGWLAFGHAFAAQGEHDQAMAAYRSAARMLPRCHLIPLCIGMELIRVNNYALGEQYMLQARESCSNDPLVYNELGVVSFKNKNYESAITYFTNALKLCGNNINESWESILCNLAHSFRKIRKLPEAVKYYTEALKMCPYNASTYTALGFTYQLQGNISEAIESYHQALGLKSDDSFATAMLEKALEYYCVAGVPFLE